MLSGRMAWACTASRNPERCPRALSPYLLARPRVSPHNTDGSILSAKHGFYIKRALRPMYHRVLVGSSVRVTLYYFRRSTLPSNTKRLQSGLIWVGISENGSRRCGERLPTFKG